MEMIHDIYDRIAKRCVSLSARSTINLINGLYGTDYPLDSKVSYNWTENEDDELKRTLADTIITINEHHSYHIEFQMTKDGDIVMRVLDYSFHHALNNMGNMDIIRFPEPMIVYLYDRESFPDNYTLHISFGEQGVFTYRIPVFKYLKKSMEELDNRKLIVLIPFQLLRLRRAIEKERTAENMEALKNLITYDILDSLNKNENAGNITRIDAMKLRRMILHLYHHIYDKYDELEREGVNRMAEEALIFDVDILDYKIQKQERELQKQEEELQRQEQEIQEQEQKICKREQEIQEQRTEIQKLEAEKRIWKLLAQGKTAEEISGEIELSLEEVKRILEME